MQIVLLLKNWSRRAQNKGLEPSCPVLHVLYGHIAVYYKDLSPDWYWLNSCILVLKEIDYLNFYCLFFNCDFSTRTKEKKEKKIPK